LPAHLNSVSSEPVVAQTSNTDVSLDEAGSAKRAGSAALRLAAPIKVACSAGATLKNNCGICRRIDFERAQSTQRRAC
jgi:hypothetical protein